MIALIHSPSTPRPPRHHLPLVPGPRARRHADDASLPGGAIAPEAAARARAVGMSLYRCQMLAYNLAHAVAVLAGTRAGEVPGEHLDSYLLLRWLRWNGLRLVPTAAGRRVGRWRPQAVSFGAAR